jgi:hypothetical protein
MVLPSTVKRESKGAIRHAYSFRLGSQTMAFSI